MTPSSLAAKVKKAKDRLAVLLSNMLTYLILAQTGLTWVIANDVLDFAPQYTEWAVVSLSGVSAVIIFIRRVTPVEKGERGLLSTDSK